VAIATRLNWGIVSIGLTNYFGGILPNSYDNRLLAEFSISPIKTLTLSGYIAPIDETSSRSLYGAGMIWQLKNQYTSGLLSIIIRGNKLNNSCILNLSGLTTI